MCLLSTPEKDILLILLDSKYACLLLWGLLSSKYVPHLNILGKITQNKELVGDLLASHAEIQVIHLLQQGRWPEYSHRMGTYWWGLIPGWPWMNWFHFLLVDSTFVVGFVCVDFLEGYLLFLSRFHLGDSLGEDSHASSQSCQSLNPKPSPDA